MSVIYCLNSYCTNPLNDTKTRKCRTCNSNLILHKRYVAIKKIGKGGFGTTYLAVDMAKKNSYCVIKQLEPATENPESYKTALNLFNREAKTLAKLSHIQIPKLLNYFEENQQFYLIQDFVLGKNLEREVKKGHIYQESSAKKFLRNILPVLNYVHSQKVIHRDIKPGNILREKKTKTLYLIDFGAVKEQVNTQLMNQNPEGAFTKISVGTMGFAPPEQLAMRPVYSSDIYALAATCVFLLTGKAPKDLCNPVTGELAWEQHTAVTPTFARVLNKMLELDVRQRFASADEVIKALELVPYEEELAESMVSFKNTTKEQNKDEQTTVNKRNNNNNSQKEEEVTIANTTPQSLADAIRKRRERFSNNISNISNAKETSAPIPPTQPKLDLTPEIISQHYKQGNRNFSQQLLNGFDLEGLKLAGASFSQSKLIGSNLENANLYRTNFYNANLAQANLAQANLRKAELYKANLKNANFEGANLTMANLTEAILKDANLSGANLEGAKVDNEQLKTAKTSWRTIFPDGKRRWW